MTRTCTDLRNCRVPVNKPSEIEYCGIGAETDSRPRGSGCAGRWNCTEWGPCIDGKQIRDCLDFGTLDEWKWKYCMTSAYEPETERSCPIEEVPSSLIERSDEQGLGWLIWLRRKLILLRKKLI